MNIIAKFFVSFLLIIVGCLKVQAWNENPDGNGKYDEFYDRPTYFPDFVQPTQWANAEYYLVSFIGGEGGPRIENYEVAVYDQNNELRCCNRSLAKDNHLCVLTIRGEEGDEFHCRVIYGDFKNPTICDVPETFGFKTNEIVGSPEKPFSLTGPVPAAIRNCFPVYPVSGRGKTFTLNGSRVKSKNVMKGIYIRDGKKVFVK